MMFITRLLPTGVLAGILLAAGCGKSDEPTTRFNETLGDTPAGAPVAAASIDTGILKDPADYQPTPYDELEGPASGAGGPEAEEIRSVISGLIDGVFHLEADTILDAFVPEQVAALRENDECITNFDELSDALSAYTQAITDKASGPDLEVFVSAFELLPDLTTPLVQAFAVSIVDEENAVATFDLARLEIPEELQTALAGVAQLLMARIAQTTGGDMLGGGPAGAIIPDGAAPPSAGEAGLPAGGFSPEMLQNPPSVQIPLLLRKVDGSWRLALPFAIGEEHAELISEGAVVFKDCFTDCAQALGQVDTLDTQTFAQIEAQIDMRHKGPILGWFARAYLAVQSLMQSQGQVAEEATQPDAEADEPESDQSEEESSEEQPGGRSRRGRRP